MRLFKKGKIYHVEVRYKGVRYRRSLWTASKTIADKLHRRIIARLELGGTFDEQEAEESPLIANLVIEYRGELERRGRRRSTIIDCCGSILKCSNDAAVKRINELDTPAIERGLSYLADRSSRTQNRVLGHFKAFFNWLNKTGRWDKNPAVAVTRVREIRKLPQRRALNDEEIERLTRSVEIPEHRRLVYLLAINTGMRRNEIESATWGDVDLQRAEIIVREANSKNSKEATIPINHEVMAAWQSWLKNPWVIEGKAEYKTDRPLPSVPRMPTIRRDFKAVGIEEVTNEGRVDFHALRVTFGSLLARNNVSLQMAQKLLRHSTPALTATIYTRFNTEDKRDAVEGLNKSRRAARKRKKA